MHIINTIITFIALNLISSTIPLQAMHYNSLTTPYCQEDYKEEAAATATSFTHKQIEQANAKLIQAITNNDFEATQEAITQGANVNMHVAPGDYPALPTQNNDLSPLTIAIHENQQDTVNLLLHHNANINISSIFTCAKRWNPNLSLLNKLLSHQVNLSAIDPTLMWDLASDANYRQQGVNALKMLALAGADLTSKCTNSLFSKIFAYFPYTPYSELGIFYRFNIYKAIALQDNYFKKLDILYLYVKETIPTMPLELKSIIIDYAISFYTFDDTNNLSEEDRHVYDVLNRSIATRWKYIKNNLTHLIQNTNKASQLNQLQINRIVNFCLVFPPLFSCFRLIDKHTTSRVIPLVLGFFTTVLLLPVLIL